MRFCLLTAKKLISYNTGNEYFKAIVFDYFNDVTFNIFINEPVFSFINDNNLIGANVDNYIMFKYDTERKAYVLSFDINN